MSLNTHSLTSDLYNLPTSIKPYQILLHSIDEGIRFHKEDLMNPFLVVLIISSNKNFKVTNKYPTVREPKD